ncbi:hypothetical protein [Halorussus caseinilyticus]|uniref:hypothetical protein n=1 Tax=Halorussus caseinilyticus TaxID=3034025 RepID=UPI0023E7CC24|nr:hypothetical protein [Halorussus sp. DT72]
MNTLTQFFQKSNFSSNREKVGLAIYYMQTYCGEDHVTAQEIGDLFSINEISMSQSAIVAYLSNMKEEGTVLTIERRHSREYFLSPEGINEFGQLVNDERLGDEPKYRKEKNGINLVPYIMGLDDMVESMVSKLVSRRKGIWIISSVIILLLAGISAMIIAKLLKPISGIIIFLTVSIIGFMKAINTVFAFIENLETRFTNEKQQKTDIEKIESPEIGGQNVSKREDLINSELKRLDDWYFIIENEDWGINPQKSISDDPKFLLYILAAKVASKHGSRDSEKVSLTELENEVETRFPVEPFINKAREFLILHYDFEEEILGHTIEKETAMVEFDFDTISKGVDWILSGDRDPPQN